MRAGRRDPRATSRDRRRRAGAIAPLVVVSLWLGVPARAQTPEPASVTLPTVVVIGVTPLPGIGIDRDKVPANVQSLTTSDLARSGSPSLLNALNDQVGSVTQNNTLGDSFQPDIMFRGFTASPVLGTPQGLAVYQNGVRINEAFGDTVNWDLIPDIAIDRVDLVNSNPVYGLNALGGAALVTMKNGFSYQGFESELAGGSFGQRSFSLQYGAQAGNFAAYVAGHKYDSDGWRQFSPDHVEQVYTDVGARGERATLDVSFTGADNKLYGEGTTPEQELAVNRTLDFTTPQNNFNNLLFVTLNGSYQATDTLAFEANAYRRQFHQSVLNGNTTNYTACASGSFLCQSDGTTPTVAATGSTIPDLSNGGTVPIGENDRETIHTVGMGGTLQTTYTGALLGHENHFVFGGSYDHATTAFSSSAEVGVINAALQVQPSGFFVNTPENTGFVATPVSLSAANDYYGVFLTDTVDLTPALALTMSGRYNLAQIGLTDQLGSNLTGDNSYSRFNPAIGATYKINEGLTAYAGYSEANRAPTPSEIECSNPTQPCVLPSSLSSDPPRLRQVVAHTYETGLRGSFALPAAAPGRFTWNLGLFRSDLTDDIYGVAASISTAFFENIGATRRQGIEAGMAYKDDKWSVYGNYSLVDAAFESSLTLPSPSNPFADANGNIHVVPGDRLPEIPEHQIKVGADYRVTSSVTVGGILSYFSNQFLRGDETNQNVPLPGYAVLNLHGTYSVTQNVALFANVMNTLDARYATFAQYGDPTGVGASGIPAGAMSNGPGVDNRFLMPAPPIAVFGGLRVTF